MLTDYGVEDEVSSALRIEKALSQSRPVQRRDRTRFLHTNRKLILDTKEAILVTLQETMYMDTPSLGLDALVYHAQKQHPGWGFTVVELQYVDGNYIPVAYRKTPEGWQRLMHQSLRDICDASNPSVVGLSSQSKGFDKLVDIVTRNISTENRLVVVGGAHASIASDETFNRYWDLVDVFVRGDGVKAFGQILDNPRRAELAEGTIRREYFFGNLIGEPSNQFYAVHGHAKDFTEVGTVPAQHQRTAFWAGKTVYRLQTATGCTYGCSFCALPKAYQTKSVEDVKQFLDSVVEDMKSKGLQRDDVLLFIEDGNFGGPNGSAMYNNASEKLDLFSRYDLNFGIQLRYDNITDEFLGQLKKGNVTYIFTSVESVDENVLRASGKGQKGMLDQIYATFRKLKDNGIEYAISFIRGLEDDTQETFMRTAEFVRSVLTPINACAEIAKVYPNTRDAAKYESRTGLNVERAYCLGTGLADDPQLGPENNGTLLLLSIPDALSSLRSVGQLFNSNSKGSASGLTFGFDPIVSNANYEELRTGFFQRI